MTDEESETFEEDAEPVVFDSYGSEGKDPSKFIESEDGPPDAENED